MLLNTTYFNEQHFISNHNTDKLKSLNVINVNYIAISFINKIKQNKQINC